MELIAKLGIDVKLLIAQIFNFLIILFVLYKFAYKPTFNMLEMRQKKIEKGMMDAEKSGQLLKDVEKQRDDALAKIREESLVMLEQSAKEAEKTKQEMLTNAREEARKLFKQAKEAIDEEKIRMMQELREEVSLLAVNAAEKILQREFSPADQKKMLQHLSQEISNN